MKIQDESEWSITTTADNAAATVTRAAEAGKQHVVTSIAGSFSTAQTAAKLMTLKDGATVVGNFHVYQTRDKEYAKGLEMSPGAAVELSLLASGSATQIGAVTMTGYTR